MTQKVPKNQSEATILEELKELLVVQKPELKQNPLNVDIPILADGLGLDSIKLVHFIVAVEAKYSFSFEEEDLTMRTFSSLRSLANHIIRRLAP